MSLWRIYNNTIITLLNISHFLPRVYGYKIQSSRVLHVYLVSAIFVLNCESLQSCWNYIDLLFLLFPPLPLSLPSVLFILIAMSEKLSFPTKAIMAHFPRLPWSCQTERDCLVGWGDSSRRAVGNWWRSQTNCPVPGPYFNRRIENTDRRRRK